MLQPYGVDQRGPLQVLRLGVKLVKVRPPNHVNKGSTAQMKHLMKRKPSHEQVLADIQLQNASRVDRAERRTGPN